MPPRSLRGRGIDKQLCRFCNTGMTTDDVLAEVGPRLRRLRKDPEVTLPALSETNGIFVRTLSRLEPGLGKPSVQLVQPIAQAHQVPLDELVGAPPVGDPRVRSAP